MVGKRVRMNGLNYRVEFVNDELAWLSCETYSGYSVVFEHVIAEMPTLEEGE